MSSTDETDKNKDTTTEKKNNFGKFIGGVIQAFISMILIGLLGANFVYLTRIDTDLFFPTDPTQRPYTDKNKKGNLLPPLFGKNAGDVVAVMKGGKGSGGCGESIDITKSSLLQNKYFRGTFDYGFPYSMNTSEDTVGGFFTSWFSNKVEYSYIWLRTVEKAIINFSESFCALTPEKAKDIVPFILGPLIIQVIFGITTFWFIPGLVSAFWNEQSGNSNDKWKLVFSGFGLMFGWTWATVIGTSFVQIFSAMFKFILLPLVMNAKDIINIMGRPFNAWWLKIIFLSMVMASAFKNLDLIIAIIMLIVFIPHFIPPGMNPMKKKATP